MKKLSKLDKLEQEAFDCGDNRLLQAVSDLREINMLYFYNGKEMNSEDKTKYYLTLTAILEYIIPKTVLNEGREKSSKILKRFSQSQRLALEYSVNH